MRKLTILLAIIALSGCVTTTGVNPETGETEVVVNPIVETAVKSVGLLPFPYSGLVEAALGAGLAGYAGYTRRKAGKLEKSTAAVASTLEKFFETPEGAKVAENLKAKIAGKANALGVEEDLNKIIKSIT